jgi:hypothetical protein
MHRVVHPEFTRRSRQRMPRLVVMLVACLGSLTTSVLADGQAEFKFGQREVWVGQPFLLEVDIVNAEAWTEPQVPEIDGLTSTVLPSARESTFTQIINGVVTTRSTRTFVVRFVATRPGIIEIPPIGLTVDGKRFESDPWRVIATKSEVGDLLVVEIIGTPERAWVGQPVRLTLQIWVEQFVDRANRIRLDEADMWGLISAGESSWGLFKESLEELARNRRRPSGRRVERGDRTYFLYEINHDVIPIKAGEIDPGEVQILLRQPTDIAVTRDIFNRRQMEIEGIRPVIQTARIRPIEVRSLPEEGRPSSFTGAVGRFSVRALAEPRDVSVGDPITLRFEVTDESPGVAGDLANLRPPPLRDLEALDGFRVPDDPTTGIVEGRTKIFTETLRPERDDLDAIPSIPFVSFDPELERYVTASSEPVPINVAPSERLDLVGTVRGEGGLDQAILRGTTLTATTGGLRANHPVADAATPRRDFEPGWTTATIAIAAPVTYLVGLLLIRRREHRLANPDARRAAAARSKARSVLGGEGSTADRVHASLCGLIADRLHLPEGAMTAREAEIAVERAGLEPSDREELRSVLDAAETVRYSGASSDDAELERRAGALISSLDALRPGRRSDR